MATYSSNQALIAAINHSNMKDGEVIVKLNGEVITGNITSIKMEMRESHYTVFEIEGIIR